jgi:cell division cycle 20-like protein 1 (cofactor of APC complex)
LFSFQGNQIAIGTSKGSVQIWDVAREKKIRQFDNHTARVGTMASIDNILTSGSRDRSIYHRDIRVSHDFVKKLSGHKQEVCGLKWNAEQTQLASGGNDNKLLVWNRFDEHPVLRFSDHIAAVKAIAWSPLQRGILASGGGTADRRIRFWNTLTGQALSSIDTGSQVCNLAWSKTSNELVSTHGYSQNQVIVWKYPTMQQIAVLTGHTMRVLYLAMSPDGQNVVTGAGDETLRFWVSGQNLTRAFESC